MFPVDMSRALLLLVAGLLGWLPRSAQPRAGPPRGFGGFLTTPGATSTTGRAQVVVRNALNDEVASVLSEGDGHFRVVALPDGRYRVNVSLAGFEPTSTPTVVTAGTTTEVAVDLTIAAISQTVEVVGSVST